jgi:hypothetical protein
MIEAEEAMISTFVTQMNDGPKKLGPAAGGKAGERESGDIEQGSEHCFGSILETRGCSKVGEKCGK